MSPNQGSPRELFSGTQMGSLGLGVHFSEEDKRATTNVQNGLVFFFLFSFILFYYL